MDALNLEAGTLIDGIYRVIGPLGEGAMGVVVRAHDNLLEREVAIKLVRPDLLGPALRAHFLSEARAMARVRHPHVLQIYSLGQHGDAPYFVMELVQGQTAQSWLSSRPAGEAPDFETVLRILDQTCQGVSAIHAAGAVHRDLKPSNLLLDSLGRVRVADLGVAYMPPRLGVKAARGIVGTPAYMAPEMVLQSDVPPELLSRADVFSLGCIAFELLTGTLPFVGISSLLQMVAQTTDEAPRVSSRRADLPAQFDDVIGRALAKDPAARTPTAAAFRRALLAASAESTEPDYILVAEDDADFRDALELMLHREFPDAVVECVADGALALESFDRKRPSIVILDLQMPNLDGMELTGLLRAREGALGVPIIVLTASGGPTEWKKLRAMRVDAFLLKPVNLDDVVTLVRRALGKHSRSIAPLPPRR